jgi:7-cyano-7-deazaguanine synthase in queuosine biosynthesis
MTANLYLRAPGERRRLPAGIAAVIHLDEPAVVGYPLHQRLGRLPAPPQPRAQAVQAFLLTTLGAWAADKLLPRAVAPDAWSRRIILHVPVTAAWLPLAPRLAGLLNFLTGDDWTLMARETPIDLGLVAKWRHSWQPQAVVLFSGGLDSLAGAIDLLEEGQRLVLVSHYDFGQLAAVQKALAGALAEHYGPERLHHLALRVQFPETRELTLRSRSLLYLALGLAAAAALGVELPLIVPENGFVSLNPPLTLNRLGTYSTRTTHPYFLAQLSCLWREAGLSNPLLNPYPETTKGELLARCRHQALLEKLFPLTNSCARPVVSRWQGGPAGSCGYCYPCLLRRAALHRLGWDEGRDYRLDVLAAPESLRHPARGRDLRALLLALKTWEEGPQEMEARLFLGESPDLPQRYTRARRLLSAGFQEVGQFFRDKGPEWIKAYLA